MSTEGNNYHKLYMQKGAGSPEYQRCIANFGRDLTPARVEMILAAHSIPVAELINDVHDPIVPTLGEMPETLDAAMLYAWLGY